MTLNCNGKILDLKIPKVMGILNLAPDSFFDGGKYQSIELATKRCSEMLTQGADIIDIGAASSKPGAKIISEKEEFNRLIPILKVLVKKCWERKQSLLFPISNTLIGKKREKPQDVFL